MINLKKIKPNEKEFLNNLLKVYLNELSIINEEEIDSNYKYLDLYCTEKNRQAFFILNITEIIGFVFVNDYCIFKTNEIAIAEFYIQKQFRNKGFAKKAVKEVLKLSNKNWEFKTNLKNKVALSFWRKILKGSEEKEINGDVVFSF